MKHRKGFWGQTNKKNDQNLITRIKQLLASKNYKNDHMTDPIISYIFRYEKIKSLTDKMRYQIKTHIELHINEFDNIEK